jgi:hypothetical protein
MYIDIKKDKEQIGLELAWVKANTNIEVNISQETLT